MRDDRIQDYTTIGLEFEFEFTGQLRSEYFKNTHDASIITDRFIRDGFIFESNPFHFHFDKMQTGTELITGIVNSDNEENLFAILNDVTNLATRYSETEDSKRSGIHYHISVSNPSLNYLKSVIKLAERYELLFYYLFTMGGKFRGLENDAIYCRPLHNPQVTKNRNGKYYYSYYVDDLLSSKSISDFFVRYGDSLNTFCKYHPVRYGWLNLFPSTPIDGNKKRTIEFRGFNKSINPFYLYSTLMFCRKFLTFALFDSMSLNLERKPALITSPHTKQDVLDLFQEFQSFSPINDEKVRNTLITIIKHAEDFMLEDVPVKTHLNNFNGLYWEEYLPKNSIPAEYVQKPNYVDIHVLRGER